jgi:hypothetical protein
MLRALLLLLIAAGVAVVTLPFLVSSLYIDQRGVEITGKVYSKNEYAIVRHSAWSRSCEVTFEYWPKEESSVSFLKVELPPERYDGFHRGQQVKLHYLRPQDIPDLPLSHPLRQMGLLPKARLAGQRIFSGMTITSWNRDNFPFVALAAAVLVLIFWRLSRLPGFAWAVGACVVVVIALAMISEFPVPTDRPSADVRIAQGRVKTLSRIDRIFSGSRSRGEIVAQPISVAGVEFVPEGRTDPVLAIDLIDEGSLPLRPDAVVEVEYEFASPRKAYLRGATREFAGRNLRGIGLTIAFCALLLVGVLLGGHFLGKAWKRLLQKR